MAKKKKWVATIYQETPEVRAHIKRMKGVSMAEWIRRATRTRMEIDIITKRVPVK